jgi:DNA topoisomerase-2
MSEKDKPKITSSKAKPYTKITYYTDFKRFNTTKLSDSMKRLITKRTYDAAAITGPLVNVYLNDEKLEIKSFEKYVDLFLKSSNGEEIPRLYQNFGTRWEVCVAVNPYSQFEQISFVNGITTYQGGKHVEYITNQVTKKLSEYIYKKRKITVKGNYIKENIFVFIRSLINDPGFNSQVKECLTTPVSKFGSKCELDDKFIDKVAKMGLMDLAINLSAFKENKDLKKSDGKKKSTIRGIPKLDDANWAGGPKSEQCTLILTEGDSAKALAISGLSIIGRDKYGVFPLKGKVLNVKGDDKNLIKKIGENTEIINLKKILGLQSGKKHTLKDLRYGSVMLLTDQDEDGSHIKGLLFNMFQSLWPELFRTQGFNKSMLTPIVKATNNKTKTVKSFYNLSDYEKWKNLAERKGFTIKYYKGLGTSTPKEAKEYFRDMKIVNYKYEEQKSDEAIELAFNKKLADSRKKWLSEYNRNNVLDYSNSDVTHEDFINKELIHFSNSDNKRSIANMVDGLKTSQRKIIYCIFKKNQKSEIRVAQFAGYVSENGGYHHGEASLQGAIVNMGQDFVGSNNINYLEPIGQFGSRIMGGSDSAQPRYIHTKIPDIIPHIYSPDDSKILNYLDDDGHMVEPDYFVPILPMILVNGSEGIGTGWSSFVPSFNPLDIIDNLDVLLKEVSKNKGVYSEDLIKDVELNEMKPWYRGFTGDIVKHNENSYISYGKYKVMNSSQVKITELPIRTWTDKYKEFLESMISDTSNKKSGACLRNYTSQCTDTKVSFTLTFAPDVLDDITENTTKNSDGQNKFEKLFKLTSKINTSNMVLYDKDCFLKKYKNTNDIIKEYFIVRLNYYQKRKDFVLKELEKELKIINARVRFILEFIDSKIVISNRTKKNLIEQLIDGKYPTMTNINNNNNEGDESQKIEDNDFDYLIKMPIYNLTTERIEELKKEKDLKTISFNDINEKTVDKMWKEELKSFRKNYEKFLKVKIENAEDDVGSKKKIVKKKK